MSDEFSLSWLADVLRAAGLTVVEEPGWKTRGYEGDFSTPLGVLCHHTATSAKAPGDYPTLQTTIKGRPDLPGPLCHLGLGRGGTFYCIAAGHANHAGAGQWKEITAGNSHLIGIEAEYSGIPAQESWPDVQIAAYQKGVAAILTHIGRTSDYAIGHKEWAPKRKIDPAGIDMDEFRAVVHAIMNPQEGSPAAAEGANPAGGPDEQPGGNG